jgi:hypothetical protein
LASADRRMRSATGEIGMRAPWSDFRGGDRSSALLNPMI